MSLSRFLSLAEGGLRGGGLLSIETSKNRLRGIKIHLTTLKIYIIEKNKIDRKSKVKTQKG